MGGDREPGRYVYRCYLRGEPPHFPGGWRRGWLYRDGETLVWRADWRRTAQVITTPLAVAEAQMASDVDLTAVRTGRFHLFRVESAAGSAFRLAVPSADLARVRSLLEAA